MSPIITNSLFAISMMFIGAVVTLLLCWVNFRKKTALGIKSDARHAADVLVHLQKLATRVAQDVDEHNTKIEEVNTQLTTTEESKPTVIVDIVAKLIQANQDMQKKLAQTEDKIRQQAREIEVHASEARTDALTLLANRRVFDSELNRRMAEFRRLNRPFSLIMADLDHFKKINDAHGHQTGDDVLQNVSKILRRTMREIDVVARYGGEEFAVIMPDTNMKSAVNTALRARETIEKFKFVTGNKKTISVTMSFGVAEVKKGEEGAALVARTDKALYAAKQGGRNRVSQHNGKDIGVVHPEKPVVVVEPRKQQPAESTSKAVETAKSAETAKPGNVAMPTETPAARLISIEADLLASLSNRTNFCQQVRSRTSEWKRGGPTFSVILFEVTPCNQDTEAMGMSAMEFASLAATKYLTSTIRDMDMVGFYATGCLSLLLPTAGIADAIMVAERLRDGFVKYCAAEPYNQIPFMLSIGVVEVVDTDDSITLLKRAEAALDAANSHGGNRTYYHDGKRCAPLTALLETMEYLS